MENSLLMQYIDLKNQFKSSANWFYWIAVLSIVNTLVLMFGGSYNFIFGLGVSQIIDSLSMSEFGEYSLLGIILNAIIAGVFYLFGYLAHKKQKSFYIIGMTFYALDGSISILGEDLLGIGFHI